MHARQHLDGDNKFRQIRDEVVGGVGSRDRMNKVAGDFGVRSGISVWGCPVKRMKFGPAI